MNKLLTGYHKVNINPPLGIGINGYFVPRFAKGYLDDICAGALVLGCDDKRIAVISLDVCMLDTALVARYQKAIEKATGIPADQIFRRICDAARVVLDPGEWFGKDYLGYMRINIAAPRTVLQEAAQRIVCAMKH